jgi:alpha-mannosidase
MSKNTKKTTKQDSKQESKSEIVLSKMKGRYSGNYRIDAKKSGLEEPDQDNDDTRRLWFDEIQSDPDFREDTQKKIDLWRQSFAYSPVDPKKIVIHQVGESHIDCAWLWRFEQTRRKGFKTFQKAVLHAKRFPNKFSFALSEPLLLAWIKEDEPEFFKELQETVKSGAIELVGGSYVEPDCMMPSGESFVRERLYGMRFYRDNFGKLPEVEWFLDSFGYNYGLPQILSKSGAKYFWTSKITWNMNTLFPFIYFHWQGPDGSKILTGHFNMGTGLMDSWGLREMGLHPLKKDGQKVWSYTDDYQDLGDAVEENEICPILGNFFGKGDGGHGPIAQEVAVANEYADLGFCKWSKVHDFYHDIEKWSDRFPVWNDELYLENHQGTFSVHAEVKRGNRRNENWLVSSEVLAVMAVLNNPTYKYPKEQLEKLWLITLKNQFHDVLPGSSIPEVYDDCWDDWMLQNKEFTDLNNEAGQNLVEKSVEKTAGKQETPLILLSNTVSWDRTSPVFIACSILKDKVKLNADGKPNYAKLILTEKPEKVVICQPIAAEPEQTIERRDAGWYCVASLSALSTAVYKLLILDDAESATLAKQASVTATNNTIANDLISIVMDEKTGAMKELTAKGINENKNCLAGKESNLTFAYEDKSKAWPAWNITPQYWKYPLAMPNDKSVKITVAEKGPVFATLKIDRLLGESPVTQTITLFNNCPEVNLQYLTDWKQPMVMLKVLYSTATKAEIVTADQTYCAIERKTDPKTPCDIARIEKIMHKYCDVSTTDKKWGMAILNEGKYAFDTLNAKGESVKGDMRITMLRSPSYPGPAGEAWVIKERLLNKEKYNHEHPEYSGLGPFKCRYALFAHLGSGLTKSDNTPNAIVKQKADEFNQPIIVVPIAYADTNKKLVSAQSLFTIEPANVMVGSLKVDEWNQTPTNNLIIRLVEVCGANSNVEIKLGSLLSKKVQNVKIVDLLEREISGGKTACKFDKTKGNIKLSIDKFEIITLSLII